jgi:RNA polymerase sigma-54 factor
MLATTFTLEQKLRLETRASPELIAYAGLLALPGIELEHAIEHELAANPALECDDVPVCPFCGEPLAGTRCLVCRHRRALPEEGMLAAEPSTIDELRPLTDPMDMPILEHVLGSLDERGFLDAPPDEIALRLAVPCARVERVISLLRQCGPPGVAAADLRECLLLQLDALDCEPQSTHARLIVEHHLGDLAARRWHAIALTRSEVAAAVEFIRLRLRPSAPLNERTPVAPPALPDVIVSESGGRLVIELVEPRRFRVGVASSYTDVDPQRLDMNARTLVEEQVAQARVFLHRLDRRWQTMRRVAELVIERQRAFVMAGPLHVVPLTRAEIAAELGVHESTVSRATHGRYVLLPSGRLVPFSRFFETAQGPCAALTQLVADERSPTSDAMLAGELARLGFPIARRTVAKYRERLGIPPHTERRRREGDFADASASRSDVRIVTA